MTNTRKIMLCFFFSASMVFAAFMYTLNFNFGPSPTMNVLIRSGMVSVLLVFLSGFINQFTGNKIVHLSRVCTRAERWKSFDDKINNLKWSDASAKEKVFIASYVVLYLSSGVMSGCIMVAVFVHFFKTIM